MSVEKPFDPSKARQVVPHGDVTNIDFTDMRNRAQVEGALITLEGMLKGVEIEDLRQCFDSKSADWFRKHAMEFRRLSNLFLNLADEEDRNSK